MYNITHVQRDADGNIKEVMLDSGDILDYLEAFDLASQGLINGVVDGQHSSGYPQIKGSNHDWEHKLNNHPHF